MSERPPLDPWGGSVNYFPVPAQCSQSMAESIVSYVAAELGIGIQFLSTETREDQMVIDAILGLNKTQVEYDLEEIERAANGTTREKVKFETPPSIVFLARLPVEEGASTAPNYELTAQKLDRLHVAAAALVRHLN